MASERDRKRIDEQPVWQQIKNSFTPGMQGEEAQRKAQSTDASAMLEALKRRRASMGS